MTFMDKRKSFMQMKNLFLKKIVTKGFVYTSLSRITTGLQLIFLAFVLFFDNENKL